MEITVKKSTMVKPSEPTPTTTFRLSNVEAIYPHHMRVYVIFVYRRSDPNSTNSFESELLKSALSRVLVDFYPVAGRLKLDGNGCIEINCNGDGVLFVEAEAAGTLDDLDYYNLDPQVALIPTGDPSMDAFAKPLGMWQLTRFRCGGVCLGLNHEHHLADGVSVLDFINAWANTVRGAGDTILPAIVDRRMALSAGNPPCINYSHVEYQPPPSLNVTVPSSSKVVSWITPMSKYQVDALKAKCRENNPSRTAYTSFAALTGHIWRCACLARQLPQDQETKIRIVVGARGRIQPPLPDKYFGNAVFHASPVASAGELIGNPAVYSAQKVHEAIAEVNNERLHSALDYLETWSDLGCVGRNVFNYPSPNLAMASWANLPFHKLDFGWGKPVYCGPWGVRGEPIPEGMAVVLRSLMEDGGFIVGVTLPVEQMEIYKKVFYEF